MTSIKTTQIKSTTPQSQPDCDPAIFINHRCFVSKIDLLNPNLRHVKPFLGFGKPQNIAQESVKSESESGH